MEMTFPETGHSVKKNKGRLGIQGAEQMKGVNF